MVICESLRINMFRITHTGKSVNFPVTIATPPGGEEGLFHDKKYKTLISNTITS